MRQPPPPPPQYGYNYNYNYDILKSYDESKQVKKELEDVKRDITTIYVIDAFGTFFSFVLVVALIIDLLLCVTRYQWVGYGLPYLSAVCYVGIPVSDVIYGSVYYFIVYSDFLWLILPLSWGVFMFLQKNIIIYTIRILMTAIFFIGQVVKIIYYSYVLIACDINFLCYCPRDDPTIHIPSGEFIGMYVCNWLFLAYTVVDLVIVILLAIRTRKNKKESIS